MGFPYTWRSEENEVRVCLHKREIGKLTDTPLGKGRLKREIEGIEGFTSRQFCCSESCLLGYQLAAFKFCEQHPPEKSIIGQTLETCLFQQLGELRLDMFEM